jgi:hypothetical protein
VRSKQFQSLHSAQTVHLYCTNTNNVSKCTEMKFHMTHSPRSSIGCIQHDFRVDGTFDTNRAPFLHQGYHYLLTDSNKHPLEPCHLGVSSGASKMIFEPMVCLAQTVHLYCTDTNSLQIDRNKIPQSPTRIGLPLGAFKTIFEPMVRLTQTTHLSCVKISTISKQTQTTFHLSLVT